MEIYVGIQWPAMKLNKFGRAVKTIVYWFYSVNFIFWSHYYTLQNCYAKTCINKAEIQSLMNKDSTYLNDIDKFVVKIQVTTLNTSIEIFKTVKYHLKAIKIKKLYIVT